MQPRVLSSGLFCADDAFDGFIARRMSETCGVGDVRKGESGQLAETAGRRSWSGEPRESFGTTGKPPCTFRERGIPRRRLLPFQNRLRRGRDHWRFPLHRWRTSASEFWAEGKHLLILFASLCVLHWCIGRLKSRRQDQPVADLAGGRGEIGRGHGKER